MPQQKRATQDDNTKKSGEQKTATATSQGGGEWTKADTHDPVPRASVWLRARGTVHRETTPISESGFDALTFLTIISGTRPTYEKTNKFQEEDCCTPPSLSQTTGKIFTIRTISWLLLVFRCCRPSPLTKHIYAPQTKQQRDSTRKHFQHNRSAGGTLPHLNSQCVAKNHPQHA